MKFVSVVVPLFNEERYIDDLISSILKQDYSKENLEILFIDGGSCDLTLKIIEKNINSSCFDIKLINNPMRTVQHAMNLGIKNSKGEIIVRMDAHAVYSPDYVSKCVEVIRKTGAQNVGGLMLAKGKTKMQKIIAAAYHIKFVLGGGKNHDENYEGFTDTVFLGAFNKKYLNMIGMYDENFIINEDDELNYRIIENGGKIFVTPEIKSVYYPRDNIKELFKQYLNYGLWKVAVIKKHKKPARISHLVPALFVVFLLFFPSLFFVYKSLFFSYILVLVIYACLNIYFSFGSKIISGFFEKITLAWVSFIIHTSYGLGFLFGLFKFCFKKFKKSYSKIKISPENLRELQLKSLDLFIRFKDFCEKNNLKFFLCGGCCIGAIRHKGFIPWDDDIDVFMPREDYERLYRIYNEENSYCIKTTEKVFSGNIFTTIVDKNTTLIKKEQIGTKIPKGITIDILPLDACPSSFFDRKIQKISAMIYSLYTARVIPKNHGKAIELMGKLALKLVFNDKIRYRISRFCEKNMSKYKIDECEFFTELCSGLGYMNNKYPKEIFKSSILKEFEGILVPLPYDYDKYLKIVFGEYMKLPLKEERIPHHDIIFMDLSHGN
ncbi:MAG: LicD family protein [Oscillospiraceae bacterium]|nr:LicD family protein [Oscillospiraceae bacterium]